VNRLLYASLNSVIAIEEVLQNSFVHQSDHAVKGLGSGLPGLMKISQTLSLSMMVTVSSLLSESSSLRFSQLRGKSSKRYERQ
jgi:hypothetical protein